jgi:hypothetical protein
LQEREIVMDFSSQALRPGEVVIWSGELEKRQHDAATKPAPQISDESRPNIRILEHCSARGAENGVPRKKSVSKPVIDERIVRAIRGEWGIEP